MKVLYLIWFALAAIVHGTIDNLDTAFWGINIRIRGIISHTCREN